MDKIKLVLVVCLMQNACVLLAEAENSLDKGLVAHYTFSKKTDSTVEDELGCNPGVIKGSSTWVKTDGGYALNFDGTTTCVERKNDSNLQISGALTLTVWVRAAASADHDLYLISKYGWNLCVTRKGTAKFESRNATNDAWTAPLYSKQSVAPEAWTFIVAVYNPITKTQEIYLDGVLDNQLSRAEEFGGVTSHALCLGRYTAGQQYFQGLMGDVRIYDHALTPEEIKALYEATAKTYPRSR